MRIGFIGIGNMGTGMTHNLLEAGHRLLVNDLRKDFAQPLIEAGAGWADTPAHLASQCDVVMSCLPGPAEVDSVVRGVHGILEGMSPGNVYVDLSSNSPSLIRELSSTLENEGKQMLGCARQRRRGWRSQRPPGSHGGRQARNLRTGGNNPGHDR